MGLSGCCVVFFEIQFWDPFWITFGGEFGTILGSKSRPEGSVWHQKGTKRASRGGPKSAKEATCRKHCPQQRKRHFGAPSWAALGPQEGTRRLKETIAKRHPKRDPKMGPKMNNKIHSTWEPKWESKSARFAPKRAAKTGQHRK